MVTENVSLQGQHLQDKHTHYEASTFIGPDNATVIIRGDVAADFKRQYGIPITKADSFNAEVDFTRNSQRVSSNHFRPGSHLTGSIGSLDDIKYER